MALLVGISGIDGSGKGYLAGQLDGALKFQGLKTALINVDGWLNLPVVRFSTTEPGEHFYQHALRLDQLFSQLVLPLRTARSARVTMDWVDETAATTRPYKYDFGDVDIIVLEGIFLYKRAFRQYFDLAIWIDCTFETALQRAIARAQEGLAEAETIRAYHTIYFPAQQIHFTRDNPRASADLIVANDAKLLRSLI